MIRSFRHKGLRDYFEFGKKTGIRPEHTQRLRWVLARLSAATHAGDMDLPGLRLHLLKGKMKNFYAVDISGNWRLVFRFQDQDAFDVDYLDYH